VPARPCLCRCLLRELPLPSSPPLHTVAVSVVRHTALRCITSASLRRRRRHRDCQTVKRVVHIAEPSTLRSRHAFAAVDCPIVCIAIDDVCDARLSSLLLSTPSFSPHALQSRRCSTLPCVGLGGLWCARHVTIYTCAAVRAAVTSRRGAGPDNTQHRSTAHAAGAGSESSGDAASRHRWHPQEGTSDTPRCSTLQHSLPTR
jgi:hypothetical protein